MIRCALESLALRYRQVLGWLEELIGGRIETIHIVGGGTQNRQLCQMAADACHRRVVAGPVEATAIGNVMMQAVATRRRGFDRRGPRRNPPQFFRRRVRAAGRRGVGRRVRAVFEPVPHLAYAAQARWCSRIRKNSNSRGGSRLGTLANSGTRWDARGTFGGSRKTASKVLKKRQRWILFAESLN